MRIFFAAFTFGPWIFSLADCRHGVLIHRWGLNAVEKNQVDC